MSDPIQQTMRVFRVYCTVFLYNMVCVRGCPIPLLGSIFNICTNSVTVNRYNGAYNEMGANGKMSMALVQIVQM